MNDSHRPYVFVLMPFAEEFDDVYMVIRDSCGTEPFRGNVDCQRADEIAEPGTITEQILGAIDRADLIIADLTGSNANVMYELGYAHARAKPTILLNQSVRDSPFDIASQRQIVYDRNRLGKDCKPRLIIALTEVLGHRQAVDIRDAEPRAGDVVPGPLLPSVSLVAQIQSIHLRMELANTMSNRAEVRRLVTELVALVDRISIVEGADSPELRNTVGVLSNCGVELERAELFQEAEDVYRRGVSLNPRHAGNHLMYSDFLVDRGRLAEAKRELNEGRQIDPTDRRLVALETKLAVAEGRTDPELADRLRENFDSNPASRDALAAYLHFLMSTRGPVSEFERVLARWAAASDDPRGEIIGIRMLADALAERDENARARELYESILPKLEGSERHDVLHNLATVCADMRNREQAMRYWRESYRMNPADPNVRAAFSQALSQWGELELAVKVASGGPLN